MSRTRTIQAPSEPGTATYSKAPSLNVNRSAVGVTSVCTDVVAVGDGHSLSIRHTKRSGAYQQNGSWNGPSYLGKITFTDFPISYFVSPNAAHFGALAVADRPSNASAATRLLAMTNPSRPSVDIPVFIGELGDLPKSVFLGGKSLLGRGASGNLAVQFGIIPLASDLNILLNFADYVGKRQRELEALAKKGLRRTRRLWRGSSRTFTPSLQTQSSPVDAKTWHKIVKETHMTVSGHVRWYPTAGLPKTDAAMLRLARRAVGGLTLDASTAWELIPFSWLIDWYINVGAYLKASRNLVPCEHTQPQIMEECITSTHCTLVNSSKAFLQGSKVKVSVHTKKRQPTSASLTASMPALSAGQLSILGSLAILRSGKY